MTNNETNIDTWDEWLERGGKPRMMKVLYALLGSFLFIAVAVARVILADHDYIDAAIWIIDKLSSKSATPRVADRILSISELPRAAEPSRAVCRPNVPIQTQGEWTGVGADVPASAAGEFGRALVGTTTIKIDPPHPLGGVP